MRQEIYKFGVQKFKSVEYLPYSPISAKEKDNSICEKYPLFTFSSSHDDEETFIKNYGNPLYQVEKFYSFVVIERDGDKLACKLFYGGRSRRQGKTWFNIRKNVNYISINTKTGDVYVGHIHDYQKKRKCLKRIQKNYFSDSVINNFFILVKNQLTYKDTNPPINEIIKIFTKELSQTTESVSVEDIILKFYLDKKGIKYPNNYSAYKQIIWGKDYRKALKKNNNKIVETIMGLNDLSGKKLKKVLHECDSITLVNIKSFKKLFKEEWIYQDEEFLKSIVSTTKQFSLNNNIVDVVKENASTIELRRIFNNFKLSFTDSSVDLYSLIDHINFYARLKQYNETDLKWMANSSEEFRQEHMDWTEKLDFYRRGEYNRIYPQYIIDKLSEVIKLDGNQYYTVLLNNSKNYNEESATQSNCVKTYIGKPSAFIVSLRKNSTDSEERLTVEYRVSYWSNEKRVICERVQTRGRFNSLPEESWDNILNYLDSKVIKLHRDEKYETIKLTKKCANGVELHSDSEFDERGFLQWTVKNIDNDYYYDNIFQFV